MASDAVSRPPLPWHSSSGSKRSPPNSSEVRLSVIVEDGAIPPIPPKAPNRPFSRRWNFGEPPRHSFEKSPPKYSVWDVTGPKGEKLEDVRNNKHIARRGGWRRVCIMMLLLATIVVALTVGLTVGLRKKHNKSNSQESSPSNSSSNPSSSLPSTNGPFPAGSYTFMTFLDTITTDCTSKPINWDCGSPSTYHESPSAASAIYQWIINGSSSDSTSTFSISSTDNPFAINFANVPLTLVDEHLQTERYTFVTKTNKVSLPSLGVRCYYNDVIFEGSLYTRRPKSYFGPSTGTTTAETPDATNSSSSAFENWKFAVDVKQSIGGGPNVPECYHVDNGVKGAKITDEITSEPAEDQCSCLYKNYDP